MPLKSDTTGNPAGFVIDGRYWHKNSNLRNTNFRCSCQRVTLKINSTRTHYILSAGAHSDGCGKLGRSMRDTVDFDKGGHDISITALKIDSKDVVQEVKHDRRLWKRASGHFRCGCKNGKLALSVDRKRVVVVFLKGIPHTKGCDSCPKIKKKYFVILLVTQ